MADEKPTRSSIEQAIAALEAQRALLGDTVDAAIGALRSQLATLDDTEPKSEDQRKQVTVLFADVQGFTSMSQTMDPEDVADAMNAIWADIDEVIKSHGGTIDKHIGDAVMALFGAPIAREDDPERAIRAALAMQETLTDATLDRHVGSDNLAMRIGIHTGLAMLGVVGSGAEYTAIGHTVNLASRLEGKAPPGGILISHDTMTHVRGLFDLVATDPIEVKGVDEPVRAYVVKRAKARTFRTFTREVAGVETKTVGRDHEIARLVACLPETPTAPSLDRPHLVTILGEPGVGKSRIIYEFFNYLEAQPHPVWLFRGRALEASRNVPYGLLRSVLFDRFLIAVSDPGDVARSKLEEGLAGYMGEDGVQASPFLGHVIGLDYSSHPAVADLLGEPKVIRERAFQALESLLRDGIGERYLVMLNEDVHWADADSLDALEFLTREIADLPLLIVTTARPDLLDRRPDWGGDQPDGTQMMLEPLGDGDADLLIDEILRPLGDIPEALRDTIGHRSEGNPFFIEELVKMLIDDGIIDTSSPRWTVDLDRLNGDAVPGTLTGVLQARIDALKPTERRAMQRASIVGRVFWESAVDRLAAATTPEEHHELLADVCDPLIRRELIYPRDSTTFDRLREFIFKHAVLRDVVYESVVKRARRTYHVEVAEWLIEAAADRVGEFAGEIADHFRQSDEYEKAMIWYVRSGDQARKSYASEAATVAYTTVLELAHKTTESLIPTQKLAALFGLGEVLTAQGRYEDAIENYDEMRREAVEHGDGTAEARAERGMAAAQTYIGRFREALESSERSAAAAERSDSQIDLTKALWMQAWSRLRLGLLDGIRELSDEVLERARDIGDRSLLAQTLNLAGVVEFSSGSYDDAISHFEEAASIFEVIGNSDEVMPVLNNIGVILEAKGDYQGAHKRYSEALDIARETNNRDGEMVYSSNLGGTEVALGNHERGETLLRAVLDMAGGQLGVLPETRRFLAEALIGQARLEEAREEALSSLRLAIESEALDYIAAAWRAIGRVSSLLGGAIDTGGESVSAPEAFERAMAAATEIGADGDRARTLASWAAHDRSIGDPDAGATRWMEARRILADVGADMEAERLETILGFHDMPPFSRSNMPRTQGEGT